MNFLKYFGIENLKTKNFLFSYFEKNIGEDDETRSQNTHQCKYCLTYSQYFNL